MMMKNSLKIAFLNHKYVTSTKNVICHIFVTNHIFVTLNRSFLRLFGYFSPYFMIKNRGLKRPKKRGVKNASELNVLKACRESINFKKICEYLKQELEG